MLFLAIVLACANNKTLDLEASTEGCEDYDFDDPADPKFVIDQKGSDWVFSRTGVLQACDAQFDPEYDQVGKELSITEVWTGGDVDTCPETCFTPTVTLIDPPKGKWTVLWYIDGEGTPFDNADFEVD